MFWEEDPVSVGLPGGGGGVPPPDPPAPFRAGSYNVSVVSPLLLPHRTLGIPPASGGDPKTLDPSLSQVVYIPPPTLHLAHGMDGIPCQPSLPCFYVGLPG